MKDSVAEALENPTEDLKFILGQPCFMFIKHAQLWRAIGHKIPTQAEAEQAFFIGRMLLHYFADPVNWRVAWDAEVQSAIDALKALERVDGKGGV